ncbi:MULTISPECIES: type 2 periplasmic-binding domain-containing protein [Pseudoalteromonas]|uniref:transporter substrate-binding domain-containing protein n=1 Tax=Pseudoalteromonas TaxID=53246 RepID=UPI002074E76E|nr:MULTISPECIES: transporter substrate-binding domain-containing protein [Pseudoalteromonas]MDW7549629.1 transporter substrate-binding domain-containing protein [Pseudoalteromonas peptidolytica]
MKATLLCLVLVVLSVTCTASEIPKVMRFNKPPQTPQALYVIELMELVYKELGIEMRLEEFNHKSSLIAANAGNLDGQLGRVASIEDDYPNLRRVDYPLFQFTLQLFTLCSDCTLNNLKSLTIRSGYPVASTYLNKHGADAYIINVKSVVAQLNLVMQRQVEGALLLDFHLKPHLRNINEDNLQIKDLEVVESFHFVHKRHATLLPLIKKKLSEFEQKGVIDMLKAKYQI